MAHPQLTAAPAKISSYAKIAAMPVPASTLPNDSTRKDSKTRIPHPSERHDSLGNGDLSTYQILQTTPPNEQEKSITEPTQLPLQNLILASEPATSIRADTSGDSADSYEEDHSQVSGSSLNKPHSFDTKSLASVTTFAMDDKESIRPDDSASVRAADDEIPLPALSRNSSFQHDNDQSAHRPARTFPANVTIPGRRFPTLANPPRFGTLPVSPVLEASDIHMPQPSSQVISSPEQRENVAIINVQPDEKLLDALSTQKDRLPLLQLEEKVLKFLRESSNTTLELPPQNSFTRLLAHKLADYYNLPHAVADDSASVRIFRSGGRGLPVPLAEIAKTMPLGTTPAPTSAAFKIMRREQLTGRQFSAGNSTAASSSVPSKAASENGADGPSEDGLTSPAESTPSRDKSKLTREEREAQYKLARDRIFADFQESAASETASNGENSASMSRSSSSSGKKKMKRNKQPKDDSFEARSAYVASYAPIQPHYTPTYADASMNNSYPASPVSYDTDPYGATPTQSFASFEPNMQFPNMQGYHQSMMPQYGSPDWQGMQAMQMHNPYFMYPQPIQFPHAPAVMGAGIHTMQGHANDWSYGQNLMMPALSPSSAYPTQPGMDPRTNMQQEQFNGAYHRNNSSPMNGPYYGHSAQKSLFNPQTRSFVPNNPNGRSTQKPGRGKPQPRHSLDPNPRMKPAHGGSAIQSQEDSLKQRYGTPASLPKKPPPPDVRPSLQGEKSTTPQQAHSLLGENKVLASDALSQQA